MRFELTDTGVSEEAETQMASIAKTFFDNGYMTTVQYDAMVGLGAEGYLWLLNRLVEVREQNGLLQAQVDWQSNYMVTLREDKIDLIKRAATAESILTKTVNQREKIFAIRAAIHILATEAQNSRSPLISANGAILATSIEDLFE